MFSFFSSASSTSVSGSASGSSSGSSSASSSAVASGSAFSSGYSGSKSTSGRASSMYSLQSEVERYMDKRITRKFRGRKILKTVNILVQPIAKKLKGFYGLGKSIASFQSHQIPDNIPQVAEDLSQSDPFLYHEEVIVEICEIKYLLISFGKDGIEWVLTEDLQQLIKSRQYSKRLVEQKVSHARVRDIFAIQNKEYDPLNWNCRHFADQLWKNLN